MKRLSENDHIDFYRHLAFCTVGGFFGAYAVLVHSGVMGNAQTMNLLEMVIDLLRWQLPDMLLHLGALALYVLARKVKSGDLSQVEVSYAVEGRGGPAPVKISRERMPLSDFLNTFGLTLQDVKNKLK